MKLVLREWAEEARRGRPSDYRGWTFFETNCLSELVKLARDGNREAVRSFLRGRDVLLPGTVLSESRRSPDLVSGAATLLSAPSVFLVPDISKFSQCDLWNFINVEGHPRNVLEPRRFLEGVLSGHERAQSLPLMP